jgi:hypothetical protein
MTSSAATPPIRHDSGTTGRAHHQPHGPCLPQPGLSRRPAHAYTCGRWSMPLPARIVSRPPPPMRRSCTWPPYTVSLPSWPPDVQHSHRTGRRRAERTRRAVAPGRDSVKPQPTPQPEPPAPRRSAPPVAGGGPGRCRTQAGDLRVRLPGLVGFRDASRLAVGSLRSSSTRVQQGVKLVAQCLDVIQDALLLEA